MLAFTYCERFRDLTFEKSQSVYISRFDKKKLTTKVAPNKKD